MAGQDAGLVDNLASPCMPLAGCCLQAVPGGAASACMPRLGRCACPPTRAGLAVSNQRLHFLDLRGIHLPGRWGMVNRSQVKII